MRILLRATRWPVGFSRLLLLTLFLWLAACASTGRVDWSQRVGNYTYDDAVKELGPADKKETLSDGTLVAEWIIEKSGIQSTPDLGWGGRWGWNGPWWGVRAGNDVRSTPERFLRLQFGPDGKLVVSRRAYR